VWALAGAAPSAMVTSVPAVTTVAADHSLRRAPPNGIEGNRVTEILPALVPAPWKPGKPPAPTAGPMVDVWRTRMVYTSPRITPPAYRARGERCGQMPCQSCKPTHKQAAPIGASPGESEAHTGALGAIRPASKARQQRGRAPLRPSCRARLLDLAWHSSIRASRVSGST